MSCWTENLAVLRVRFPEVAQRLGQASRGAANKPDRAAPRPSPEDAALVAGRWLRGRRIRERALLAVSGFGDGNHVQALLNVLPPHARVFVAEENPANLRAALETADFRPLLEDARLLLGTGPTDDANFLVLNAPWILHVSEVEPWLFAPCFNRAPEYYARFFTEFARHVDVWRRLHGTRVKDAELWQANTLENLPVLAEAPDLACLKGALRGLPIVLVSAGPSLDESIDFLRAASEVAVIVAVNTSYRAVRRAGIVPSFVVAADPRGDTARGFTGVPVDGTWLVTTHIVNPQVVQLFDGRIFSWTNGYSLVSSLRRRCGLPPGTSVVERGTVSACVVDLAVALGSDRVCLVGQDLAIREDGRTHAVDSFYTDAGANQAATASCRRLPGNTLPTVPVEEKLYVYLRTFEQLAAHRPQLKFLNTARLGVRIAGVPYGTFDEALRWLGKKSTRDVAAVVAGRHAASPAHRLGLGRAREVLRGTAQYVEAVLRAALRAAVAIEQLPGELMAEDQREAPAVRAALEAVRGLREEIDRSPEDRELLEGGRTRYELFLAQRAESKIGEGPEHWRQLLRDREFAWAMAEGAWFLTVCLQRFERVASERTDCKIH